MKNFLLFLITLLFYVGGQSTACGPFRALWHIRHDSLYLDNILACSDYSFTIDSIFFDSLVASKMPQEIIRKLEPLKNQLFYNSIHFYDFISNILSKDELNQNSKIFFRLFNQAKLKQKFNFLDFSSFVKNSYIQKNLFFYNYSGTIAIEIGNIVDSMRVYWHKTTDKVLYAEFRNGKIVDKDTINSVFYSDTTNGRVLSIGRYKLCIPYNFNETPDTNSKFDSLFNSYIDTVSVSSINISYKESSYGSRHEWITEQRNSIIDSMHLFPCNILFSNFNYVKLLHKGNVPSEKSVPYICWVNGIDTSEQLRVKIITIASYSGNLTITIRSKNLSDKEFDELFLNLIQSIYIGHTKFK